MSVAALMQALGQLFTRSNPLHSRYAPLPFYPEAFREIMSEAYTDIADEDSSVFSVTMSGDAFAGRIAEIQITAADKSVRAMTGEFIALLDRHGAQYEYGVLSDGTVWVPLAQFDQEDDEGEALYPVVMDAIHRSKDGISEQEVSTMAKYVLGGDFRWSSDTGRKLREQLDEHAHYQKIPSEGSAYFTDRAMYRWFRDKKTAAAAIKAARLSRIRA